MYFSKESQSLINQGNILTFVEDEHGNDVESGSQSLINQGNILTMKAIFSNLFNGGIGRNPL